MPIKIDYTEIVSGNREVFNSLMEEHYRPAILFAYRILNSREAAEEVVQDVFVNIWLNRKTIDFGPGLKTYIYISARNLAYNHIRNTKRLKERLNNIPAASYELIEAFIEEEEAHRLLNEALDQLPPRTAEVMRLSLMGKSREEIASMMDVSVSNVKNLKAIGVKKLKEILDPLYCLLLLSILS